LWDLATREEVRRLRAKGYWPRDINFSADGKIVAAADSCGVTLWDARTGDWLHDLGHTGSVGVLAFTPDGKTLMTGADRFLRSWDPFTGRLCRKWKVHERGILAIRVAADGKRMISIGSDGSIRVGDRASGKEIGRIGDGKRSATAIDLSSDGKLLATSVGEGIQLWDLATRQLVRSFARGFVHHLAFSPDGTQLASSTTNDAAVRLWNVANGKELHSFHAWSLGGSKPSFSPDGRTLATSDSDGKIPVWDLFSGKELRRLGQPLKPGALLGALTFSPDGRVVAAGYSDRTVRLLEVATGKERAIYQGHRGGILSLAFSPDGQLLASGSVDRTVMVWDVTGRVCADKPDRITLDAKAQERLWAGLADTDAAKAYQAMRVLLGAEQTVNLLRKRLLRPAVAVDPARLNRLVAELDDDSFSIRERASRELAALEESAIPALRRAQANAPSVEVARRVKDLLAKLDKPGLCSAELASLRAVEVLEHLGTFEARQLLAELGKEAGDTLLTREARVSLQRLEKRTNKP
ncbi:MAG TPA: WD40 repeat domain-containing protein, partial [Gemmataceae bacterium]